MEANVRARQTIGSELSKLLELREDFGGKSILAEEDFSTLTVQPELSQHIFRQITLWIETFGCPLYSCKTFRDKI